MRIAAALILISLAFTGCLSNSGSPDTMDGVPDQAFAMSSTLYLDKDGGLVAENPAAGREILAWSWGEWFQGIAAPVWYGPASDVPYVITEANVTIQYEAAMNNAHTDTRPPFTIWFGAGDSIIEHAFAAGPNPWLMGEVETITFPIDSLPKGGLVVEPGDRPVLHVGHYYGDGEEVWAVNALVGGPNPSRLDWKVEPVQLPTGAIPTAVLQENGELLGGRCVAPLNVEGSAQADYTFEVPANAVGLDAVLQKPGGQEPLGPDMDFYISGPDGKDIAHAAGSAIPEAIHLRQPNMDAIGPGTWGVHVYNCQPQRSEFYVSVALLLVDEV